MKTSFSTLACPDWDIGQILSAAVAYGYDGVELRFVQGEASLYKLASFRDAGLTETRSKIRDEGLMIPCLDTSCLFHSPEPQQRHQWIDEGERMAALAEQLGAPGIRVFGDRIQPGANREATRGWIAESIATLSGRVGVAVWLESHGDFAQSSETLAILQQAGSGGVIWDPANAFLESYEDPRIAAPALHQLLRHVHLKDMLLDGTPALMGQGEFAIQDVFAALAGIHYDGFVSFEWEKKWHPEIAGPEIALPQFIQWMRSNA